MKKLTTSILVACLFLLNQTSFAACNYERDLHGDALSAGIFLTWATNFEENNALFIIEKSTDGLSFTNIGAVKAIGNSSTKKEYTFFDTDVNQGKTFYRLRQINKSGTYNFSKVLILYKETPNQFMVTHTSNIMASDQFEILIDSKIEDNIQVQLKDRSNNNLNYLERPLNKGTNMIHLDLADLKPAIYKIDLKVGDEVDTLTFEKIKNKKTNKPNIAKKNPSQLMTPN